jgi:hypothetical protein
MTPLTALPQRLLSTAVHHAVGRTVDRVRAWPVESQQGARRNAMVAATALAARRAEHQDVEDYLAGLAPREPAVVTTSVPVAR